MFASILLLVASVIGHNYGWEPLPDGGVVYVFQFAPEELATAQEAGVPLESEIRTNLDVRSIKIQTGTGPLPRIDPPLKSEKKSKPDVPMPTNSDAKSPNSDLPAPLLQSAEGKPLATPASFNEQTDSSKTAKEPTTNAVSSPASELVKPWPLICALLLLFISLAGNIYLLWIFADLRKRYRAQLAR
jgi:hypothetical protein